MARQPSIRSALLVAGTALALGVACSGKTLPYAGGLMVAVQTDLKAPDDVAAVGLYVTSDGRPIFGDTRDVAPNGEVKFPATIAVLADASRPRAVVKIRAVAFKKNGDVRVLRDVITTIPKGRTGLLRTPLLWINEGSGSGSRSQLIQSASLRPRDTSDGFSRLTSACPDGQTFIDGECGDANVDGDALPEYADKDVFGGGDPQGNGGRCFDVLACFQSPAKVEIDAAACTGTIAGTDPNDPNLSLFVVLPPSAGAGECTSDGKCLVALDKEAGWKVAGTGVQFPKALCKRLADGVALGIAATKACPSKDATTPACGPASAVGSSGPGGGGFDAGPISVADAGGDGGNPDAGDVDAAVVPLEFGATVSYTAEPFLTSVGVDDTWVYLSRSDQNPTPPGVVRLAKSDVLVPQQAQTTILTGYGSPTPSRIVLSAGAAAAQQIVVRAEPNDVRLCQPSNVYGTNDCPSFTISGPRDSVAAGPTQAFVYGTFSVDTGVFAIPYSAPTPTLVPILPSESIASMLYVADNSPGGGTLYLGTAAAAIYKCPMPCQTAADATQLRPPAASPAVVTALAASPVVPTKLFFLQVPAGSDPNAGGVFEVGIDGSGEFQLGKADELFGPIPPISPPATLAVDSRYVYWGGGFDASGGGGRRSGLITRNHVTRDPSRPIPEPAPLTDAVTGVAVDGTHVFWTYDRSSGALVYAPKKGSF